MSTWAFFLRLVLVTVAVLIVGLVIVNAAMPDTPSGPRKRDLSQLYE